MKKYRDARLTRTTLSILTLDYGTVTISLPYQVPDGSLFMMGDDRSVSIDSRTVEVGCVTAEYLVGKVVFRIWPLSNFGAVD